MGAYVCPSVRMYLSASCVRVKMLAFVCVHARVREAECVSPSVRPSVHPSFCLSLSIWSRAYSCVQMFDRTSVRSSLHTFVCLHARMREGVRLSLLIRLSVSPRACSCVQIFDFTCVRSIMHAFMYLHMRAFINPCATFHLSHSYF